MRVCLTPAAAPRPLLPEVCRAVAVLRLPPAKRPGGGDPGGSPCLWSCCFPGQPVGRGAHAAGGRAAGGGPANAARQPVQPAGSNAASHQPLAPAVLSAPLHHSREHCYATVCAPRTRFIVMLQYTGGMGENQRGGRVKTREVEGMCTRGHASPHLLPHALKLLSYMGGQPPRQSMAACGPQLACLRAAQHGCYYFMQ